MKNFPKTAGKLLLLSLLGLVMTGCGREGAVSFSQEVRPILDQNCIECHQVGGIGEQASGFSMETYDDLMKGTNFGPMIIAGDTKGSNLLVLMEGRADPSINMPHGYREPVSTQDIQIVSLWIDQGAKNN